MDTQNFFPRGVNEENFSWYPLASMFTQISSRPFQGFEAPMTATLRGSEEVAEYVGHSDLLFSSGL
jgi:hypothetical protein